LRGIVIILLSLLGLLRCLLGCPCLRLPCPSTVRTWLLRAGLFLLHRAVAVRSDWVWIVDHTLRIGMHKCLLILGISLQRLRNLPGAVEHRDVVVLDIQVTTSSNGEDLNKRFAEVAKRVGVPSQIVSDHGADLAKGIRLFAAEHPAVVDTYDVSHFLACSLRRTLEGNDRWQRLLSGCTASLFALQQTAGAFLSPATARTRARYLNVGAPIERAQQLLHLVESDDVGELAQLLGKGKTATRAFVQEKLGWLKRCGDDVEHYARLHEVVERTQEEVKRRGLSAATAERVWEQLPEAVRDDERAQPFLREVRSYLETEGGKIPNGESWLGTSDVIESLFGKYKWMGEQAPWAEVGANVLLLPLMTVDLTSELIRQALDTVSGADVRQWVKDNVGPSLLSKVKATTKMMAGR
jgi:hypothetical protein